MDSQKQSQAAPSEEQLRHVDGMVVKLREMRLLTSKAYRTQRDTRNLNDKDMAALDYLSQEWGEGREVSPKDIAAHLGLSSATTTSVLDRLETDGYLARRPSSTDRRAVRLDPAPSMQEWSEQDPTSLLRASFLDVATELHCADVVIIESYFAAVLDDIRRRLA
ncbi:MarR family winged helix-turn-helix transcriptional regulator [Arthrobacter sp. CP30]